ncbi:MAG: pre-rRNA-processing protein PNO1 [Halobacteria archaeon]
MSEHVKIPQDRIGVLIGKDGETKKQIEEKAEVELDIDSESGAVEIQKKGDPIKGLKGPEIVKAIARGFPPESALKLMDDLEDRMEMVMFETVNIKDATGSESEMREKKGRLIGRDGRTRELMEELTGADVRIYGKTLGVIGTPEQVEVVVRAAEMLLNGSPHSTVYSYLENKKNELTSSGIEYI